MLYNDIKKIFSVTTKTFSFSYERRSYVKNCYFISVTWIIYKCF